MKTILVLSLPLFIVAACLPRPTYFIKKDVLDGRAADGIALS